MLRYIFGKKPSLPTNSFNFRAMYPFQKRLEEAERVLSKHPDKVPIILEKSNNSNTTEIDKHKWLISKDITIAQFLLMIRQKIKIDATEAIFLFVDNNYLPSNNETLGEVYEKHKNNDKFLYCTYSKQECYGKNSKSSSYLPFSLW